MSGLKGMLPRSAYSLNVEGVPVTRRTGTAFLSAVQRNVKKIIYKTGGKPLLLIIHLNIKEVIYIGGASVMKFNGLIWQPSAGLIDPEAGARYHEISKA